MGPDNCLPAMNGQSGLFLAPDTLVKGLEDRLTAYNDVCSMTFTAESMATALAEGQWERRCAAVKQVRLCKDTSIEQQLEWLAQTLDDDSHFVRMAAVQELAGIKSAVTLKLLFSALADDNWQVREMAVLSCGSMKFIDQVEHGLLRQQLERALDDPSHDVRSAAQMALQQQEQYTFVTTSLPNQSMAQPDSAHSLPMVGIAMERKAQSMLQPVATSSKKDETLSIEPLGSARKKRLSWRYLVAASAVAVILIASLTAATLGFGWWNMVFGNPDLYATVNQQQTFNGVTIRITRAYADEGRTVIAYDISANDHSKQYYPNNYDLTGSFPQKESPLSGTEGDPGHDHVVHYYMVVAPFLVPAGTNTLTLDWTIPELLVVQPGVGKQPGPLAGQWHFSFTIPFHHENNHQLPDPIDGHQYVKGINS